MCPEDKDGNAQCNREVLEKLKQMNENKEQKQNPLWKGLDKFRNI